MIGVTNVHGGLVIEAALYGGYIVGDMPPYDRSIGVSYSPRQMLFAGNLTDCLKFMEEKMVKQPVEESKLTPTQNFNTGSFVSKTDLAVNERTWGSGGGDSKKIPS